MSELIKLKQFVKENYNDDGRYNSKWTNYLPGFINTRYTTNNGEIRYITSNEINVTADSKVKSMSDAKNKASIISNVKYIKCLTNEFNDLELNFNDYAIVVKEYGKIVRCKHWIDITNSLNDINMITNISNNEFIADIINGYLYGRLSCMYGSIYDIEFCNRGGYDHKRLVALESVDPQSDPATTTMTRPTEIISGSETPKMDYQSGSLEPYEFTMDSSLSGKIDDASFYGYHVMDYYYTLFYLPTMKPILKTCVNDHSHQRIIGGTMMNLKQNISILDYDELILQEIISDTLGHEGEIDRVNEISVLLPTSSEKRNKICEIITNNISSRVTNNISGRDFNLHSNTYTQKS